MYDDERAASKEVDRPRDVPTELQVMEEALKRLGVTLETLEMRLDPVLRPAIKNDGRDGATPMESRVPLANMIREHRFLVERASSAVQGLIDRLHL
jgi:hypothetical protein